jgi:hypothetical protein
MKRPPKVEVGVIFRWWEPLGGGIHYLTAKVMRVGAALQLSIEELEPPNSGGLRVGSVITRPYSAIFPRFAPMKYKKPVVPARRFPPRGAGRIPFNRAAARKRPVVQPVPDQPQI